MWQSADDALAWAEICLDHEVLEKRARNSGYLDTFDELTAQDGSSPGVLDLWRRLIALIDEYERATRNFVIRNPEDDYFPEPDDEPARVVYGCPTARACDRLEHAGRTTPPLCHLAKRQMAERGSDD